MGSAGLIVLQSLFNTFGEEFIFRGALLPGSWDWVANAVLFGLYHLHQPWGLPGNILSGLMYAFSAKHYRSTWFSVILHSGQSLFFIFLILGLVLGLAYYGQISHPGGVREIIGVPDQAAKMQNP